MQMYETSRHAYNFIKTNPAIFVVKIIYFKLRGFCENSEFCFLYCISRIMKLGVGFIYVLV